MPDSRSLFIFGMGFSSKAIAEKSRNAFGKIVGTTRSPEKIDALKNEGFDSIIFDGAMTDEIAGELATASHLLISIAPGEADPILPLLTDINLQCPKLEWIGYLSTVGVYGNHDGEWVDELTELRPVSKRSKERVAAENSWRELATNANLPLAIFRLSGIYGPGRNTFKTIEKGKSRRLVKPGQVFNRIHVEDIGTAVALSMQSNIGGIFNITDDMPAPPQDVVTYAYELIGKEPPAEIDFETADLTPMARSFYGENKRVSNAKSKSELGMSYKWPNYKVSLQRMWEEGLWR